MKTIEKKCLDCGSIAIDRTEVNCLPQFRMESIRYACGATLKTMYSQNGNTGRAVHSGCGLIEEQVAPL